MNKTTKVSTVKTSKLNEAWGKAMESADLDILKNIRKKGKVEIMAAKLKEIANREPRLMVKFDSKEQLPEIFKQKNLGILPISRKGYVVSQVELFQDLPKKPENITYVPVPKNIETVDFKKITSEPGVVAAAKASGMLNDFFKESQLVDGLSGRKASGVFDFKISGQDIHVDNAQMEIDATLESNDSIYLVEAKAAKYKDYCVRQSYYPYRHFVDSCRKKVVPCLLLYDKGLFRLLEYEFKDKNNYNSFNLVREKDYKIQF